MKKTRFVLTIVLLGTVIGFLAPASNLNASEVQYVPGIFPPIPMGTQPASCFAPGTRQSVVEFNAARAIFSSLAVSLTTDSDNRFQLANRWTRTATNGTGLGQGDPTVITWSVVADGVDIPGLNGESPGVSDLRAFLDGIYGNEATWMPIFQSIFDSWGDLTGFNYVYENADDGAAFSGVSTVAPGVLGVRADIRIGGHFYDGDGNVLAYNFFPNNGEMVIDTGDNFYSNTSGNSLGLRNVLAHEHGHGMGLLHVCPINETKLMEPFVSFAFDGPQHDDILAANRHYGDANEHNDTFGTSTLLGSPGSTTLNLADISIDDVADSDYFGFTVLAGTDIDVTVTPIGSTYLNGTQRPNGTCNAGTNFNSLDRQNLAIEIIDLNGTTVIDSSNSAAAGLAETLTSVALNSGAGTYFAKISGDSATDPQLYTMTLTIRDGGVAEPTGACCATDGTCSEITNSACTLAGGTYQGPSTLCFGITCPIVGMDLSSSITEVGGDPVDYSTTVTYSVSYANVGNADALNPYVNINFPANIPASLATITQGQIDAITASVVSTLGTPIIFTDTTFCEGLMFQAQCDDDNARPCPIVGLTTGASGGFTFDVGMPASMPLSPVFDVTAPPAIAGSWQYASSACGETGGTDPCGAGDCFGPRLFAYTAVTAPLELVDDGAAAGSEGCGTLTGFTSGSIAVVDRGTCNFGVKSENAEAAGASGVIIINSTTPSADETIVMSGGPEGAATTIPSVMITFNQGTALKAELGNGATATFGGLLSDTITWRTAAFTSPDEGDTNPSNDGVVETTTLDDTTAIFSDGFESGTPAEWSGSVP